MTPDTQPYQLSLLPENGRIEQEETLECTIDQIRARFGYGAIQRGVMLTDRTLSALNPQADHIIFPDGSM